jgi:threonine dehydratase
VLRTPLRASPWLSEAAFGEVLLKLETLQPTSSYKIRGAFNVVLRLLEEGAVPVPLVTASAGNHGRALAQAAVASGLALTVYVSESAPRTKLDAIRALGVDLRTAPDYDEAERRAKQHAAGGTATFISPYSHPDVIAGAGTVGLEMLADRPDLDEIVVPMGGGGLISGIAIAAAGAARTPSITGVEVEASQPFTQSRAAGQIVPVEVLPTLADGLAGNLDPDTVTFEIVERHVDRIVTVGEDELRRAMRGIVERERLVAEGAGAVGVAAVLAGKIPTAGRRVAVVLSGANVDGNVLREILEYKKS